MSKVPAICDKVAVIVTIPMNYVKNLIFPRSDFS